MAFKSKQEWVSDGSLSSVTPSIKYLDRKHLHVTVSDPSVTWVWDGTIIKLGRTLQAGETVQLVRHTPIDTLMHLFSVQYAGAGRAAWTNLSVDENFTQLQYVLEEMAEGTFEYDFDTGYTKAEIDAALSSLDATLRADLANGEQAGKGPGMIAYNPDLDYPAGFLGHELKRMGRALTPQMFDPLAGRRGHDSSAALRQLASASAATSLAAHIPCGIYDYSGDIQFEWDTFGDGCDSTILNKVGPGTIFHSRGRFEGIGIFPIAGEILSGDTSDGFVMNGVWRKWVDVHSEFHGGNAAVFESGNLSRLKIRAMRSGKHGLYAPALASGDNRAVQLWLEATRNGMDGLHLEAGSSVAQTASHWTGFIITQNNAGQGFVLNGRNNSLTIYSEKNGNAGTLGALLQTPDLEFLNFSYETVTDLTGFAGNEITSPTSSRRRTEGSDFGRVRINSPGRVGYLEFTQTADREFLLNAGGSSSAQTLRLSAGLSLLDGNGIAYTHTSKRGATLNFGSVPAGGYVERIVTLRPAALPAEFIAMAMPRFQPPPGITWAAYSDPSDSGNVIIRVSNITNAAVTVPAGAWMTAVSY